MKQYGKVVLVCCCYTAFLFVGGIAGAIAGSVASLLSAGGAALLLAALSYHMHKNRAWAFWVALAQVGGLTLFFGMRFWHTSGRVPFVCGVISLLVFLLMLWFRKNQNEGETCGHRSITHSS